MTVRSKIKQIRKVLKAESIDMGGFPVKQALPLEDIGMLDPFLLVHHGKNVFDPNQKAIHQGVGPHPHRGFSPVTFMINGEIHHRDSRGNDQVAGPGEVQWMTAGAGIIHSERPSQKIVDEQTAQEFVQLWINTPAANKMDEPRYYYMSKKDIPVVSSNDLLIQNKLIAGAWKGIDNNLIETDSELLILWSKALKGGKETIEIPDSYNTMIYLVNGQISIDGKEINAHELVIFEREGTLLSLDSKKDSEYLIISGKPVNERIFQHGPFVMNTRTEILQAIRDYQMGKMGVLIENP